MDNMIRFSLFGNYEKFSTTNLEAYVKLIEFFGKKGYRPATSNELQLQPNGQARVLIMPNFIGETGELVEITSGRINFQKNIADCSDLTVFNNEFKNAFGDTIALFLKEMMIESNRVAINCDIFIPECDLNMPTQSSYFETTNRTEMSVRNVSQEMLADQLSNVIFEKYVAKVGNVTKYSYDINSVAENVEFRFNGENVNQMYEAYIDVALNIQKGMK
nr:hypothetical protein [uncultured Blautia sp.]